MKKLKRKKGQSEFSVKYLCKALVEHNVFADNMEEAIEISKKRIEKKWLIQMEEAEIIDGQEILSGVDNVDNWGEI